MTERASPLPGRQGLCLALRQMRPGASPAKGTLRLCLALRKIQQGKDTTKNSKSFRNSKRDHTMGKEAKTNAMRILERAKVAYTAHEYPHEEGVAVDGIHVAQSMGEDPACVYKTLVTQGASRNYFVFVIPVAAELDLKAAARSVGEKSVAMIHVADINKVTGYVRGGCSPVGMKKQYVTVGKIVWGDTMEIKDGLSDTDYIAFAYSKNAKEGVKTQKSSEATS